MCFILGSFSHSDFSTLFVSVGSTNIATFLSLFFAQHDLYARQSNDAHYQYSNVLYCLHVREINHYGSSISSQKSFEDGGRRHP
jgi:hypothetical protein